VALAAPQAGALLGPVFETCICNGEPYLKRMCEFWSSVALMTGRSTGRRWPGISRCRRRRQRITLSNAHGASPKVLRWESPTQRRFSRQGQPLPLFGASLSAVHDLATWAETIEVIERWRCVGCMRVEASRPCVGVCRAARRLSLKTQPDCQSQRLIKAVDAFARNP
jgi:hypothetical protein